LAGLAVHVTSDVKKKLRELREFRLRLLVKNERSKAMSDTG
jgi:hypothetical protein